MQVKIDNRPGGTVEYNRRRWEWFRTNGGREIFPRDMKRDDVRRFIARVALTTIENVTFHRGENASS